jgi:hypothetical protein
MTPEHTTPLYSFNSIPLRPFVVLFWEKYDNKNKFVVNGGENESYGLFNLSY